MMFSSLTTNDVYSHNDNDIDTSASWAHSNTSSMCRRIFKKATCVVITLLTQTKKATTTINLCVAWQHQAMQRKNAKT